MLGILDIQQISEEHKNIYIWSNIHIVPIIVVRKSFPFAELRYS